MTIRNDHRRAVAIIKIDFEKRKKIISVLKKLDLSRSIIRGTISFTLLIQGAWPKLNEIDLGWTSIDDEGLQVLSQANWPLLEALDLTFTQVTKKGVLNLVLKGGCHNLKVIKTSWNNFANCLLKEN